MKITVVIKYQFGLPTIHPVNGSAKDLASIAGTKTLTIRVLRLAEKLGHEVWYEPKLRAFHAVKTSTTMLEELVTR